MIMMFSGLGKRSKKKFLYHKCHIFVENKEKIKEHISKINENTVGEEIRNFVKYNLDFYHRI